MRVVMAVVVAAMLPAPALARDLCSERPGLGTPACTVEPGHVQIETGLADWTREREDGERVDTTLIGATNARFGVGEASEIQFGWTPLGHVRDDSGTATRAGDARVGFKRNLAHPDGHGVSFALLPFATLPLGRGPVGAGDWGAGLVAPLTWDVADALQLELTSEVDAAVDTDRHGRHLAYSAVAGAEWDVTGHLELTAEMQAQRDRDPGAHATSWQAALSAGWQPNHHLQFDVGAAAGLDHDAPRARIYGGVTALF